MTNVVAYFVTVCPHVQYHCLFTWSSTSQCTKETEIMPLLCFCRTIISAPLLVLTCHKKFWVLLTKKTLCANQPLCVKLAFANSANISILNSSSLLQAARWRIDRYRLTFHTSSIVLLFLSNVFSRSFPPKCYAFPRIFVVEQPFVSFSILQTDRWENKKMNTGFLFKASFKSWYLYF